MGKKNEIKGGGEPGRGDLCGESWSGGAWKIEERRKEGEKREKFGWVEEKS